MTTNEGKNNAKLLLPGLIAGLVLVAGWSMLKMRTAERRALAAAENLHACREIAGRIEMLQDQPLRAGIQPRSLTELARRIEQASQSAGLTEQQIARVTPQSSRRVEDSTYMEQPTIVRLEEVRLTQLVNVLYALVSETPELDVSSIRITAPRHEPPDGLEDEPWDAEVLLTYLYFAPKTVTR